MDAELFQSIFTYLGISALLIQIVCLTIGVRKRNVELIAKSKLFFKLCVTSNIIGFVIFITFIEGK